MITLARAVWRKSSRSSGNNGACVELACAHAVRAVRDSKNPVGGVLVFHQAAANRFIHEVKAGLFTG